MPDQVIKGLLNMFKNKDSPSLVSELTWFQKPCFIFAFIFFLFDFGDFALPVKGSNMIGLGNVKVRIEKIEFIKILEVKVEHLLACDFGMIGQLIENGQIIY